MRSGRVLVGRMIALACIATFSALASMVGIAYEQARFEAALAQRGGVVLALVTDWCTTCSKQGTVVAELLSEPRFKGLTLFVADFDREVELRRQLRVAMQGTFVVFKNGREVSRSTGVTDREAIVALFAKAL